MGGAPTAATQGASVSVYAVAKGLGHGGDSMVKRVYGHLGHVRHGADVVEYRVEQHGLGERLATVRATAPFGTTAGTTEDSAL